MYQYSSAFTATQYEIESEKIQTPFRIVFFSDLHACVHGKNNEELIRVCEELSPDIILAPGDMIMSGQDCIDSVCHLFASLENVYVTNGNHETSLRKNPYLYRKYKEKVEESGACLLNNQSLHLNIRGNPVCLTGFEPDMYEYFRKKLPAKELETRIGKSSTDEYQILMAHTPSFAGTYVRWGADLSVCGHYHGGIVRIFGRPLIGPKYELFPHTAYGMYEKNGKFVVVTSGIGSHDISFRFNNPMEVVYIDVNPYSQQEPCSQTHYS